MISEPEAFEKGSLDAFLSAGVDPASFRRWINFYFDRPENAWYWDESFEDLWPEHNAETYTRLIGLTFVRAAMDLAGFTGAQLGYGFTAMLGIGGEEGCAMHDKGVPNKVKLAFIRSIALLYEELLEKRCSPEWNENFCAPLDHVAFIIPEWPLGYWSLDKLNAPFYEALQLEVCERILLLGNPNCAYGALHMLNHLYDAAHNARIKEMIEDWVARNHGAPAGLRDYAIGALAHKWQ